MSRNTAINTLRRYQQHGSMPVFLNENNRVVSSLLWLPFSYLVLVVLGALGTSMANLIMDEPIENTLSASIGLIYWPLCFVGLSVIAAMVVAYYYRSKSSQRLGLVLRSLAWILSLPARGWFMGFVFALMGVFAFMPPILAGIIGALITWWLATVMTEAGAATWVIVLVAILISGTSIGGMAWANQHGSGFTEGVPVLGIILAILGFIAFFGWLGIVIVLLALLALPLMATVIIFYLLYPHFEPEWLKYAIAGAALAVLVAPPLIAEGTDEIGYFVAEMRKRFKALVAKFLH